MSRYQGKHRKPSSTGRTVARFAVAGAVVATPIAGPASATAASSDWDALARCESSGNWAANTGNGFSGGLQFTPSTWAAFGGTEFATNPANASREQQILVAERVLAAQGPGAWPVCSVRIGFTGGSGTSSPSSAPDATTVRQASPPPSTTGAGYTVQAGDTLGKIAAQFGVDWQRIYERNTAIVSDPNLIFPGQLLDVP
jgi:resuscitation-promoting factor RpfA